MNKKRKVIMMITVTGLFSTIAIILQYFELSIPFLIPAFVKFDISELPALIASFALGPWYGAAICIIKNVIHIAIGGYSGGIGELCNAILGISFVVPAGYIYRFFRSKKGALFASLVGSVMMAVVSFPTNLFISYPFYTKLMPIDDIIAAYNSIFNVVGEIWQALLIFNLPFTLLKGLVVSALTFVIYKYISKIIKYFYVENNA